MYFIGVTTHQSSIMKVFPRWADYLGLDDVVIQGMNFRWHDEPENYRKAVAFIRQDPLSLGALVTTHKIDLLHGLPRPVRSAGSIRRADGRDQQHLEGRRAAGGTCQGSDHQRPGAGSVSARRALATNRRRSAGTGGRWVGDCHHLAHASEESRRESAVADHRHQSQPATTGGDPRFPRANRRGYSVGVSPHASRRK